MASALMSEARSRAATAEYTSTMKSVEGEGWCSRGVPAIGTKGTTKGYTPRVISRSLQAISEAALSPRPASR